MGRTACTEPQCLYKGALYLFYHITSYLFGVWHHVSAPLPRPQSGTNSFLHTFHTDGLFTGDGTVVSVTQWTVLDASTG